MVVAAVAIAAIIAVGMVAAIVVSATLPTRPLAGKERPSPPPQPQEEDSGISPEVRDHLTRYGAWCSVVHERGSPHPEGVWRSYTCGCENSEEHPTVWRLCDYHDNMQGGTASNAA